jgi:hypothetical protein
MGEIDLHSRSHGFVESQGIVILPKQVEGAEVAGTTKTCSKLILKDQEFLVHQGLGSGPN